MSPSDEKTEKATPKKREDARKEGQVLKSTELSTAILMLAMFSALRMFGGNMISGMIEIITKFLNIKIVENSILDIPAINVIFNDIIIDIMLILLPMFAVAMLVGLVVNFAQVGFMLTPKVLTPKFNKINPFSGFKRIFSMRSVVEMLKSIIKISIVGIVVYQEYMSRFGEFPNMMHYSVIDSGLEVYDMCMSAAMKACVAFIILGVIDFLYQWWEYEKNLRMTKQEVKDEYKQMEGDPKVKSKIKEKQRQMSMSRMMQAVPQADVVITNPTHYAVALKYNEDEDKAPVCIAKGRDFIALKIKEKARESGIEIVENKPLAQSLYISVEIGDSIPEELFAAVAEILAKIFIMKNPSKYNTPRQNPAPGGAMGS